jgi:hypothetical protein
VTPSRDTPTMPPKKPSPPPPLPALDTAKNLRQTIAYFDTIVAAATPSELNEAFLA